MESTTTSRSLQDGRRNYFGKFKFVLKLLGVSLDGNECITYNVYSLLLIFFVNFSYALLDTLELLKHDIETVVNMALFPISYILTFAKIIVFMRNRSKLGKLLNKLEQEPFLPTRARGGVVEEKLIGDFLWILNAQAFVYWGVVIATLSTAPTLTLISRIRSSDYHDWEFPYGPFTIVNVTYSPNYELSWLYQIVSVGIISIQFSTMDLITTGAMAYVAFQFRILQNNIRRIVEISYDEMLKETASRKISANHNSKGVCEIDASLVSWEYLKKSLAKFVNYYLAVISIADELEDVFSGLLLFVFLNTLGSFGFFITHPTLVSIGGSIVISGQIFGYSFWGEEIMYQSQEVGRAAFEANFVGADLRFQKSLLLIMRRSQNPTVITAKNFAVVGLSTFTWIMRASYSASALIQQIKQ